VCDTLALLGLKQGPLSSTPPLPPPLLQVAVGASPGVWLRQGLQQHREELTILLLLVCSLWSFAVPYLRAPAQQPGECGQLHLAAAGCIAVKCEGTAASALCSTEWHHAARWLFLYFNVTP